LNELLDLGSYQCNIRFSYLAINQVGIDPYNYLIDRIPDDNIKVVAKGE